MKLRIVARKLQLKYADLMNDSATGDDYSLGYTVVPKIKKNFPKDVPLGTKLPISAEKVNSVRKQIHLSFRQYIKDEYQLAKFMKSIALHDIFQNIQQIWADYVNAVGTSNLLQIFVNGTKAIMRINKIRMKMYDELGSTLDFEIIRTFDNLIWRAQQDAWARVKDAICVIPEQITKEPTHYWHLINVPIFGAVKVPAWYAKEPASPVLELTQYKPRLSQRLEQERAMQPLIDLQNKLKKDNEPPTFDEFDSGTPEKSDNVLVDAFQDKKKQEIPK